MKTKREIATLYFPDMTPKSASEKLTSWINNCKPLVKRLSKTGYKSGTHTLSDRQISIIYDYLGEPWVKKRDPLLSPCKGEAGYLFRLRSFLKGGLCIWPPPYRGKRGGLIHSIAQIVNLLTNEIHSRKSVRKYAILAHSATLWPSEHCKTGEKMTDFFRPKNPKNSPKSMDIERWKHGYCRVIT